MVTQMLIMPRSASAGGFDLRGFELDDLNDNVLRRNDRWDDVSDNVKPRPVDPPCTPSGRDLGREPPKSILRRSDSWPPTTATKKLRGGDKATKAVRFPAESSMIVTAVHVRPRTHVLDHHVFYYSRGEIRRFKREVRREREEAKQEVYDLRESAPQLEEIYQDDELELGNTSDDCDEGIETEVDDVSEDNSFWRSKAVRQWGWPSSLSGDGIRDKNADNARQKRRSRSGPQHSPDDSHGNKTDDNETPPGAANAGVLSSIFMAVTTKRTPSPWYYDDYDDQDTACAVDTLYLF